MTNGESGKRFGRSEIKRNLSKVAKYCGDIMGGYATPDAELKARYEQRINSLPQTAPETVITDGEVAQATLQHDPTNQERRYGLPEEAFAERDRDHRRFIRGTR